MAANRKASGKVASRVLPPVPDAGGKQGAVQTFRRAGELLPKNEREALQRDLGRLAKIRRDAETSSATLRLS